MKFYSRKDNLYKFAIGLVLILLIFTTLYSIFSIPNSLSIKIFISTISLSAIVLLLFSYFKTYYIIKGSTLYWYCGIFRGQIDILKIRKIKLNQKAISGIKATTSFVGIWVHYNQFDDIYFSPENETLFVEKLKSIQPKIEVI